MPKRFNLNRQRTIRKTLRNNATKPEQVLWSRLKGRNLLGFKFRRQQGILRYVLDFYCPEKRLAVEVDGVTHSTDIEIQRDKKRQAELEAEGIRFVRVTNEDVMTNLDEVLNLILEELEKIPTSYYQTTPKPHPLEKEGDS